jgi:endo-beta-N-acetylglucosaminidase D
MLVAVIHDIAEMYKEENKMAQSVQELRSLIIQAFFKIWEAGSAHRDNFGRASIPHAAQAACLLVNHGQFDQAKVAALETLIDRKYLSAEGDLRMLKRNRRL